MANDDEDILDPAEIDALFRKPRRSPAADDPVALLDAVTAQLASADLQSPFAGDDDGTGAQPFEFQQFDEGANSETPNELENQQDDELDLRIELGRTELSSDDVVKLREGSVVALDKLAGDPVDILANGRLVARGEVLVLKGKFCVRVAEILAPARV